MHQRKNSKEPPLSFLQTIALVEQTRWNLKETLFENSYRKNSSFKVQTPNEIMPIFQYWSKGVILVDYSKMWGTATAAVGNGK